MPRQKKAFPSANGSPSLHDVAELIKQDKAKNIIVLVGAGISTAAGIPDFRSPETGLYANLEQYNLPYPEAIFDLQYLYRRPEAFYTLAKEIYPGNYLPTYTHYFFVLLHRKGILKRVFSQNVDTLERLAGLPGDMLVEAHGSFATATCLSCKHKYDAEELRPRVARGEVLRCQRATCKGKQRALIKSDIVFFGENLPASFFKRMSDFPHCDLLITIGTSLKVQPFASLIDRVGDDCPRLLINLESVGEMDEFDDSGASGGGGLWAQYREEGFDFHGSTRGGKEYARDVRWLGHADAGVRELVKALGWETELDELYSLGREELEKKDLRTRDLTEREESEKNDKVSKEGLGAVADSPRRAAKEEVRKVTREIGEVVSRPSPSPPSPSSRSSEDGGDEEAGAKELPTKADGTSSKEVDDLAEKVEKVAIGEGKDGAEQAEDD